VCGCVCVCMVNNFYIGMSWAWAMPVFFPHYLFCLSFSRNILKTDAARITKRDITNVPP